MKRGAPARRPTAQCEISWRSSGRLTETGLRYGFQVGLARAVLDMAVYSAADLKLGRACKPSAAFRRRREGCEPIYSTELFSRPSARERPQAWCPLNVTSTSVFAAMMKSFRWRPRILLVHQVTVTRPHSVRMAGW